MQLQPKVMVVLQADENPFLQKGTKSEFDGRHNLSVIVQTEDGCIESEMLRIKPTSSTVIFWSG